MQWYNEPSEWNEAEQSISITTDSKTDFWQKTHYGFQRDNGHFYYQEVDGDFVVTVKVSGQYKSLYDQAGLMVRHDENTWMKCGIEFVHGKQFASTVVTRDYSDWSVVPLGENPPTVWFKVKREGATLEVFYSLDGTNYGMMRTAHLIDINPIQVGLMCASPEGAGFTTLFEEFEIKLTEGDA
jgi:regulation of enolase protein 1 (concanavalin A-like superfamily)